jgi:hypothetical protein
LIFKYIFGGCTLKPFSQIFEKNNRIMMLSWLKPIPVTKVKSKFNKDMAKASFRLKNLLLLKIKLANFRKI